MKAAHFIFLALIFGTMSCVTTSSLEGRWKCVSAVVDGKPLRRDAIKLLRLTLTQDRYTTEKRGAVLFDSTYTIDASKNPKEINMVGTEGDLQGKEAQGIYRVSGGTLRICYTMPGNPRPRAFASPPGSKVYLIVWEREKWGG